MINRLVSIYRKYRFSVADPPVLTLDSFLPLALLLLLSLAALFYHLLRKFFSQPVDFSLDWNLFLSWIPLLIAFMANIIARRFPGARWPIALLSCAWLLYFPNAPYMITDLVHLSVDYARDITWHDVIMLFYYAEVSLFNGLVSMYWIHRSWQRVFTRKWGNVLLFASLPLAGLGVYLGRIGRLNSWDLWHNPGQLFVNLLSALTDRTAVILIFELALLLGMLYLVLWTILRFRIRHRAPM